MSSDKPSLLQKSEFVLEVSSDHKATPALAVDPSGARMVTGGMDGVLKFWEFSGMNGVNPGPFRELIPVEGHPINALSYNASGSLVLCVTSDARARIFDREGTTRPVEETIKGDQYIRTPENTKGHTHNLSYGEFHPRESNRFMTSSYDSTVRLWDLHTQRVGMDQNIPNLNCFKCVDARNVCGGNKMYVSTATYSGDGSQVVAGCSDGSIHLFHERNKYGKGLEIVRSAHLGSEITCLKFLLEDSLQLLSRGMDDCVKFWDMRKFKDPVRTWSNIETARPLSNIAVSPDASWLVMGTGTGELACIDMEAGVVAGRHKLAARQLIRTEWNPKLNQIISTSSDGNLFFFFDEDESKGGALSFVHKQPSKHVGEEVEVVPRAEAVFSYDELVESGKYRENKLGDIKAVSQKTQVPRPVQVAASGNVLAALERRRQPAGQQQDIQQYLLAQEEDKQSLITSAYKRTQPEKILDFSESKSQVDDLLKQKTYCPRCGLKICSCGFMASVANIEGPSVTVTKKQKY